MAPMATATAAAAAKVSLSTKPSPASSNGRPSVNSRFALRLRHCHKLSLSLSCFAVPPRSSVEGQTSPFGPDDDEPMKALKLRGIHTVFVQTLFKSDDDDEPGRKRFVESEVPQSQGHQAVSTAFVPIRFGRDEPRKGADILAELLQREGVHSIFMQSRFGPNEPYSGSAMHRVLRQGVDVVFVPTRRFGPDEPRENTDPFAEKLQRAGVDTFFIADPWGKEGRKSFAEALLRQGINIVIYGNSIWSS